MIQKFCNETGKNTFKQIRKKYVQGTLFYVLSFGKLKQIL